MTLSSSMADYWYSRTPLIRPPSESHWCGRIRGMVAREGFVYERKPLSVTRNVVVWEGWSLVRVVVRKGFYCMCQCGGQWSGRMISAALLSQLTVLSHKVERSSSVVECRTRNQVSPGSNPPLLPFRRLGIFCSLHRCPCSLSCINEYLAIDSGGNVSDLVLARNCCLARMLPGEAENGVGMNRSVREGTKCEALWAVQRTGYCAI